MNMYLRIGLYIVCVCVRVCRTTGAGVWHDLFNPHALLIKEWACSWVLAVAQKCELIGGLEALFPNDFPQSVQAFLLNGVWSIVPMTIQWLSPSAQQIVSVWSIVPQWLSPITSSIYVQWCVKHCSMFNFLLNDYPQWLLLFNGVETTSENGAVVTR